MNTSLLSASAFEGFLFEALQETPEAALQAGQRCESDI